MTVLSPWEHAARHFEASTGPTWDDIARPNQLPPPLVDPWLIWLFLAGRGAGKTRSASEATRKLMLRYPGCRVALVGATFADVRDTMIEGESGALNVIQASELRGGSIETAYNRSMGELFLANGSQAKAYSSEKPGRLRGPQHHVAWGDELAQWKDSNRDPSEIQTTWSNLMLGLRLPALPGWPGDYQPRVLVTTTPKRCRMLAGPLDVVRSEPHRAGLTQLPPDVVRMSTGTTYENLDNLAEAFKRVVVDPLKGTRLGRQELDGVLLGDVEGALLKQEWIDRARVHVGEVPNLVAVATAIDPATTTGEHSDETGIVTAGVDPTGDVYVLDDSSGRHSPDEWGRTAWAAALEHGSQAVVLEDNQGGDMAEAVLKAAWLALQRELFAKGRALPPRPPIVRVHPTGRGQGKWARAVPVALLYEQAPGRVHHVVGEQGLAAFAQLEDQLTTWTGETGEPSPDRVDALVHGVSWLMFPAQRSKQRRGVPPQGGDARWAADRRR